MLTNTAAYHSEGFGKAFDPATSVFVSANAGAGKTRLLTNRVLSLLAHGVAPSRILCLTFTKAAAAEMSNRILAELGAWVMMDTRELSDVLAALLSSSPSDVVLTRARSLFAIVLEAPEGLRIQTIHSFSQSLLKRFPVEAAISPHFAVMDSRTEQEMLKEARTRLFNQAQAGDAQLKAAISALAHRLSEASLNDLFSEIISQKQKLYSLFAKPGGMDALHHSVWQTVNLPPDVPVATIIAQYMSYDAAMLQTLQQIVQILDEGSATEKKFAAAIGAWLENPEAREAQHTDYLSVFLKQDGDRRAKIFTRPMPPDDPHLLCLLAEQERVVRLSEALRARSVAIATLHMLTAAHALLEIYDGLKRAYGRMDYDDLILNTRNLLKRSNISSWVLFKLDGGIDHVLVDEAQDTSPEQWQIIDALTQEFFAGLGRSEVARSLFIVGDEKQSIFSFQGADVQALGNMQRYFLRRINEAAASSQRLQLRQSYRSTREVLQAVDAVFARAEAREGLMFENIELIHEPTRLHTPGLVEIWPVIAPAEDDDTPANLLLARHLAQVIHGWIEGGVTAGDIMVLVRRRSDFVDRLARALKRKGVAVGGADRMLLGENLAVQDLLALCQCVLLPEDDLSLAALLKSPIFEVSEETLFELAYGRANSSLWERLGQSNEASAASAFSLLTELRRQTDFISPYELYAWLLDTQGARSRITGRMGEEYSDAIDEFLAQALLYERGHTPSLQGFLHWLTSSEGLIKRDMEQARDSVRILTVHGAKGLQAPIVILPDSTEPPRSRDRLLWHEESGIALWSPSSSTDDPLSRQLRAQQKQAMNAEYRRLLYVALTRAEDRLYICGADSDGQAGEQSWYRWVRDGLADIATPFSTPHGEGLRIGVESAYASKKKVAAAAPAIIPPDEFAFLARPVPAEPTPPRPLAPSRPRVEEPSFMSPLTEKNSFQRGLIIHRLLQHLPALPAEKRREAAQHLVAGERETMSEEALTQCIDEAIAVIEDVRFAELFSAHSLAEVPVTGVMEVAGRKITVSGQIDRLFIGAKDIWIVDFKTGRLPPEKSNDIAPAYMRQLYLYRQLVKSIYPDKTINCALLWTSAARIDVIGDALLDEGALSSYI